MLKTLLLAGAAALALTAAEARELTLGTQDNEATPVFKGAEEFARSWPRSRAAS